ncbi:hypothetical protein [Cellulomonas sp. NS3]|uniref:hypothetical protein n=1 Tax=Cellulomonas sp. NS3 TaxID=2973977 RepID=UPI002867F20E|nr:hypothetical protein [Cellulomonas sp. NS3]
MRPSLPRPALASRTTTRRAATAAVAVPLALLVAAPSLAAARVPAATDGDVEVTNTETVQARLDASGMVREARVYEQLTFTGTGTTSVDNPVSERGLRNLDGFGGLSVRDGALRTSVDVDGAQRLRTVSDFAGDLPLGVDVEYRLDGETVTPREVLGRSGLLEVRYTVTNLTARDDEVEFADGAGGTGSETAETVVPLVGQLVTTLPPTFTAVASEQANISGDGRGGTRLTYQMTLFPPIGSSSLELGYTARISRGVVPPATITALPVSPLTSASFKGGSASYASGAQSGVDLTAGALEIDANLLRLHDGAAELLAGLVQLRDGAAELSAGLVAEAAPGADTLAAGLDTAHDGAAELAAGARRLDTGAEQLADGGVRLDAGLTSAGAAVPQLLGGLTQLDAGLVKVDDGLAQLSGSIGLLPESMKPLHDGVASIRTAVGAVGTPNTLVDGVNEVRLGVGDAVAGLATARAGAAGVSTLVGTGGDLTEAAAALRTAAAAVQDTHPAQAETIEAQARVIEARAARLAGASGTNAAVIAGLDTLSAELQAAIPGIVRVECGLSGASLPGTCPADGRSVTAGLAQLDGGIDLVAAGVIGKVQGAVGSPADGPTTLRGGVGAARAGVGRLATGGRTLAGGLGELATGASTLRGGATTLAQGTDRLSAGAAELAGGTERLASGADELAAGIGRAADGSAELADGLVSAADGAPALVDGAQRLSTEGTSLLAERGRATASDYGVKYAVIEAGAERAVTEGMAFGAPEGAAGATAYSLEIAGVDGAGARSLGRGIAAVALFAIGAVVAGLLGRRTA